MGSASFRLGNIGGEFYASLFVFASAAALAVAAFPVLVAPVRNDQKRCARGRFTYWFMLLGYCVGGHVAIWRIRVESFSGPMIIGFISGVFLGNVIGWLVGHRFKMQDEEA